VVALEGIWNEVTRDLPCFTLCGYDTSRLHDDTADRWSCACAEHAVGSRAR
jgi:hypothetical protein